MTRTPLHYEPQYLESGKVLCLIYDRDDVLMGVSFDEDSAQWMIEQINKSVTADGE